MIKNVLKARFLLLKVFLLLLFFEGYSQNTISGIVEDQFDQAPIAFVNISIAGTKKGTTSDIDGKFTLDIPSGHTSIIFSHINYDRKVISSIDLQGENTISLKEKITNLNELVFFADENPAYGIIRNVIDNRKNNNPKKLNSYSYKSYNKEVFRLDINKIRIDSISKLLSSMDTFKLSSLDSGQLRLDDFAKNQHVMLIESVAETKFVAPGLLEEKVLATKVSGISSPLFASTGSQYRSFAFYDDIITVLDKEYINPLIGSGLSLYEFYLMDTSFYESDTVYTISFEPRKGKRFEALKGIMSICVNGYAIKNMVAESADENSTADIRIQQLYERIDGVFFPVQLNTDINFKENSMIGSGFKMEGKSYLSEINVAAGLSKKEFSDVAFEIPRIEDDDNVRILKEYRFKPLDSIELKTYDTWDTLAYKIDKYVKIAEIVATERIPLGPFDIKINDVFRSNQYENVRLGIGGTTNSKLSKRITFDGYVAYGIGDKNWKYGGGVNVDVNKRLSSFIRIGYSNDIDEVGRIKFFKAERILNQESMRNLQSSFFDKVEKFDLEVHSRILPFTYFSVQLSNELRAPAYNYALQLDDGTVVSDFNITEASIALRYVKNERYMRFMDVKILPQNDYPVVKVKVTKGLSDFTGVKFNYLRFDLGLVYIKTHRFGKSNLYLNASYIDGQFPYGKGITGWGNKNAYINVPNYFQTMGLYEFLSDKAVGFFFNHNFGNILVDTQRTKPELLIYHNMAYGELTQPQNHLAIAFNTLEKGYFESGLGLKNLIRFNYMQLIHFGFGVDAFYRYGSYGFSEIADNFAFTLNFDFGF